MLDGKINKMEHISKERREQAFNELQQQINQPKKKIIINNKTEYRDPNKYYSYLKWKCKHFDKNKEKNKIIF